MQMNSNTINSNKQIYIIDFQQVMN